MTLRQIKLDTGGVDRLALFPFVYRKAGASPIFRKWSIPFGVAGYVALFEIEDASTVTILAVRHQLEDDYLGCNDCRCRHNATSMATFVAKNKS